MYFDLYMLQNNTWSLHPKHLPQLIKCFRVVGSKKARLQLFQCSFGRERDDVITHSLTLLHRGEEDCKGFLESPSPAPGYSTVQFIPYIVFKSKWGVCPSTTTGRLFQKLMVRISKQSSSFPD